RGDISSCSFAFALEPGDDSWSEETDDRTGKKRGLRTIKKISRLFDCSPVTTPAYSSTTVSALTPQDFSSMPKISDRALAECRARGISTYTPRPRVPLVDDEDRLWIMRENARKLGEIIEREK